MVRRTGFAIAALISLAAMSSNAAAQAHGPGDSGGASHGASHASDPSVAAVRREDRLVEQSRRAVDEARDRSTEARAEHPPDAHAADEARPSDPKSGGKETRKERRHRKAD